MPRPQFASVGERRSSKPATARAYVPLGSRADRRRVDAAALLWLTATVLFWRWWLSPDHVVSVWGSVLNSLLLGFEFLLLPLWFIAFTRRARRPDRRAPLPDLRSAMIVTKAPSEPWPVVRRTLEAMLAQSADVPYDVWLADERPGAETRAWCAKHGVEISSREGVVDYQRDSWPRRARCKEGNLAFFYDHYGYRRYDVVCQFDADHVPEPAYLSWVLKAFSDTSVGYVAAPSICDANARTSWAARGRLHLEAALHGVAQAGANEGWAPCAIGSHYAVRTQALHDAGGLGPELAEDFSTSLKMQAAGWNGAFAIDAIARGDGPATAADAVTQDLQWSQSMMTLLLDHAWTALPQAAPAARVKLAFCLLWYPLGALVLLAAHALPVVALVSGRPIVAVDLAAFGLHLAPCVAAMLLLVWAVRRAGWLRPADAPILSWEAVLFVLMRWPWTVIGCVRAIWVRVTGRAVDWKVTPKGEDAAAGLPSTILLPSIVIAVLSALPVLLVPDPGAARGYLFWAVFNALLYLAVAVAVLVLHVSEHTPDRASRRSRARIVARPLVASLVAACIVAPGVGVAAVDRFGDGSAGALGLAPSPAPWNADRWNRKLVLGVTTPALAANASTPFGKAGLDELSRFDASVHARTGIAQFFMDFTTDPRRLGGELQALGGRGRIPQISLEPWDHRIGLNRDQPPYALRTIIRGDHDARLAAIGREVAAYGRPVYLRFAHEMDNPAYPWHVGRSGNRPGEFARAWRHVRRVLRDAGASNALMVWSPLATTFDTSLFPGADQVDVIGMTGFNGGSRLRWSGWRPFADIFEPALARARKIAPGVPVQISEVSSAEEGGDKAAWISGMWRTVARHPEIQSVLWFDLDKEADWRHDSSPASDAAFANGLRLAKTLVP